MAYYGPKTLDAKGDTVYYTIPESALEFGKIWSETLKDSSGNEILVEFFEEDSIKKRDGAQLIFLEIKIKKKNWED